MCTSTPAALARGTGYGCGILRTKQDDLNFFCNFFLAQAVTPVCECKHLVIKVLYRALSMGDAAVIFRHQHSVALAPEHGLIPG